MGSEDAAAIQAVAAGSEISQPLPYDETQAVVHENGTIQSGNEFNVPLSENKDASDAPVASTNGDAGSGWLNASSSEGNVSCWLSADGAPVTLAPSVPSSQHWALSSQRTFYLVRIPRLVDEKLRIEIRAAETRLEQTIKKRDVHMAALQEKKNSKLELLEKLKPIRDRERACRDALQGKRMELEPFSVALNKFRSAQNKGHEICSTEEELNDKIAEIQFRIQHESIPLKEEKQLLREIKQLESTRSQVCANSVLQAELMENFGPKEDIQDQAKFLRQDLDSIRKEHTLARKQYDAMDKDISKLNEAIEELRQQYERANAAQQDAYTVLRELKRQENLKNDPFYQNRRDVQAVRQLASQKKFKEVEDVCQKQVEEFMATWNTDIKYRAEYLISNERSTVRRLETLDGRSLGPNEKPPVVNDGGPQSAKAQEAAKPTTSANTAALKISKGSSSAGAGPELSNDISSKETKHVPVPVHVKEEEARIPGNADVGIKSRQMDLGEERVVTEAQAAEEKERVRQEQMAKAKEAEDRKKKRSEKLESRALARAKKDAERKEKVREKKAQKKATSGLPSDATDMDGGPDMLEGENPAASTEPAMAVPEESSKSTGQPSTKERKGSGARRKLPVKDTKASRPPSSKRSSKKAALPIPLWAIASLATLVLLVALIFFVKL